MTLLHRGLALVAAAAVMTAILWGSHAPLPTHRSTGGMLRLAWSARPERIETCRQRTAEELAQLPQHMRQPVACEGSTAEYRLQVRVNGVMTADRIVHGGGLRRDRRLYVFDEVPIRAGDAAIEVRLDRVNSSDANATDTHTRTETTAAIDRTRLMESVPPHLSLERRLSISARGVVLVTYDRDRRELTSLQDQPR